MAHDANDFVRAEVILQLLGVERAPEDRRKCAGTRPAGRPTQELAGDRPEERRAPTQELDRQAVVPFNFEWVFCLCIAFEGDLSEVVYAVGSTSIPQVYPRGVGGRRLDFLRYAHVVWEIPVGHEEDLCGERGLLLTSCGAWSCADPVFPWTRFGPGGTQLVLLLHHS